MRTAATSALPTPLPLQVGAATDPGLVRPKNEDYLRYEVPDDPLLVRARGSLFLVADGVGGMGGGAVASAEAVHAVLQEYYLNPRGDAGRHLRHAIQHANLHVYNMRVGHPDFSGMQTTLTALAIRQDSYWLGHVGDSKAFLLRDGTLRPLTRDHTVVEEMRRLGLLDQRRVRQHPHRHLLTRTIGGEPMVAVDLRRGHVQPGDCFILATDGIFEHLEPEDVRVQFENSPPDRAAATCVAEATRRGGYDNLTVLRIRLAP